jgi:HD-GYP domain-containing protein (c-di-GMP phosphodiesterase class II)
MLKIPLIDIVMAISSAIDLVSSQMSNHQKRVAYIAYSISTEMALADEDKRQILLAGLLHDCGAFHEKEKFKAFQFDFGQTVQERHNHGNKGWKLLRDFEDLRPSAKMIKYHHIHWNEKVAETEEEFGVPLGSYIIHLADRIDVLIDRNEEILSQRTAIENAIRDGSGELFMPDAVDAFLKVSAREYFWFDLVSTFIDEALRRFMVNESIIIDTPKLFSFAGFVNKIIDFRSNFTATHSIGVAECARILSGKMGFPRSETQKMTVAGLLHDLGKLAIPISILEKEGPLTRSEFDIMKMHTFYSYRIIEQIPQMETINQWASFHHERVDGGGYPFRLGKNELSPGSRIMAISDVFTALTEDRPYRRGMSVANSAAIIDNMVREKHLDGDVFHVFRQYIDEISHFMTEAQSAALVRHTDFLGA